MQVSCDDCQIILDALHNKQDECLLLAKELKKYKRVVAECVEQMRNSDFGYDADAVEEALRADTP